MKQNHSILILIRGLPGSGKSFLTKALAQKIGLVNSIVLDPDATDYKSKKYEEFSTRLTKDGLDEKFHPYRYLRAKSYDAILSDKIIIWNQAFTNLDGFQKTVANLQSFAIDNKKNMIVLVVEVVIDPEVAKSRIADRVANGGHDVPKEEFQRFLQDYRSFEEEGYNIVKVTGDDAIELSVEKIIKRLAKFED